LLGEQNSLVVEILRRLCQFLQSQGKAADAQAIWRESVEIRERQLSVADTPDRHAALYLDLVTPMLDAGQVDQAKEFCGKALDLNPTNIALLNSVAWLLVASPDLHQRDAALAVRLADRAVALSPTDGNIVNTLGVAQYRAGNFKEAIEVLQHSVELHKAKPEPSDFLFLAMAYQKGGDAQAARRCYGKANSLNIQATQNPELRLFLDEAKEVMAASDPRKLSPR
jgi:tetratricopeptide (TPR) repeat protein